MPGRIRLSWSLIASAILHIATAAALTRFVFYSRQLPETFVITSSRIHIVHRETKPRSEPSAPPHRATISAPSGWSTQDIGFEGQSDVAMWLDWKNQSANFVPRVFLWQRRAITPEMRNESLQRAVAEILSLLRAEKDTLYVSRAQRVCYGTRPGWFFSYVKPWDDPPLHYEETISVDADTVDRATYARPAGQQEDSSARDALNSLC